MLERHHCQLDDVGRLRIGRIVFQDRVHKILELVSLVGHSVWPREDVSIRGWASKDDFEPDVRF